MILWDVLGIRRPWLCQRSEVAPWQKALHNHKWPPQAMQIVLYQNISEYCNMLATINHNQLVMTWLRCICEGVFQVWRYHEVSYSDPSSLFCASSYPTPVCDYVDLASELSLTALRISVPQNGKKYQLGLPADKAINSSASNLQYRTDSITQICSVLATVAVELF